MSGRKIKRGLPLFVFEKVNIDDELFNERDKEAKMAGKNARTNGGVHGNVE